ncbi:MAG: tetratricopeptide repeat protein [Symploca sp. SIO2E6]|nr:tetratricopeptide repeat protein [Symploca sp. SIO2E6]
MKFNLLRLFQSNNQSNTLGGRYKVISELGAGGFGKTFVAQDLHLPGHPQCVVKQLKPQVSDAKSLQMARRLFDTEAQVLYQLGSHDQIPRLLAHFEDNQEFYLAQEFIEGDLLSKELVQGKSCSAAKVIKLLQDILEVLTFVHQQDVIHRDIKPSNLIRRRQDGKIVLIDFGAVKQVSTRFANPEQGQTKTISIGTQGYTPKEQLGGNPRFSSDVYAVGMIGIQALTGVHPRYLQENPDTGEIEWRHISEGSPSGSRNQDKESEHPSQEISPELGEILDRMVCYDFRDRYQTAAQAWEALSCLPGFQDSPQNTTEARENLSSPVSSTDTTLLKSEQSSTKIWESSASSEQSSTDIWQPSASSSQSNSATSRNSTGSDAETSEPSLPSTPTVVAQPWLTQRPFLKLGAIVAVLAAVGGTFWFTKNFSSSQTASQTTNLGSAEVESASPKHTSSPAEESPSPSPEGKSTSTATSKTDSPKESPSPSPESKSTATPTVNTASSTTPSPSPESKSTATPTANTTNSTTSENQSTPTPTTNTTHSKASSTPKSKSTPSLTDTKVPSPSISPTVAPPKPSTPAPATPPSTPPTSGPTAAELLKQADSLRQAENYQKALRAYEQAIASKSNVPEAHWGRCYSLNKLGRGTEAIAACDAALSFKPNYPEALWSKGSILEQQQPLEALKLYDQALDIKPNFADAWQNKGVTLYKLRRYSEALSAFEQAIALQPNSADAWSNRGAVLWALQDFDEAIASMDKAIQLEPNNQAAINLRQQVRQKLGR